MTENIPPYTDLATHGYCVIPQFFGEEELADVEKDYKALFYKANQILTHILESKHTFGDYYRTAQASMIVVPEDSEPTQACRFEYLTASSSYIREQLVPRLAAEISKQIGEKVRLFKDKCNIKAPGGGAFTPHQDIPAYIKFGPNIHITAAVFLDAATEQNGALEFATNYKDIQHPQIHSVDTVLGTQPIMPMYEGGNNNGRILREIETQLNWKCYRAKPGDVILFNSYVPHRSEVNNSTCNRRAYFFTFNLALHGAHYADYYAIKRQRFDDPQFHIATPTIYEGKNEIT